MLGSIFPFELGIINEIDLEKYGTINEFTVATFTEFYDQENSELMFKIYIGKSIEDSLPDPCVIDYFAYNEIELFFVRLNIDNIEKVQINPYIKLKKIK